MFFYDFSKKVNWVLYLGPGSNTFLYLGFLICFFLERVRKQEIKVDQERNNINLYLGIASKSKWGVREISTLGLKEFVTLESHGICPFSIPLFFSYKFRSLPDSLRFVVGRAAKYSSKYGFISSSVNEPTITKVKSEASANLSL